MKLEVGKEYKTRDGRRVKITASPKMGDFYRYCGRIYKNKNDLTGIKRFWTEDGISGGYPRNEGLDLISEWAEKPTLKLEVGKKYVTKGGYEVTLFRVNLSNLFVGEWGFYILSNEWTRQISEWNVDGRSIAGSYLDIVAEIPTAVITPGVIDAPGKYVTRSGHLAEVTKVFTDESCDAILRAHGYSLDPFDKGKPIAWELVDGTWRHMFGNTLSDIVSKSTVTDTPSDANFNYTVDTVMATKLEAKTHPKPKRSYWFHITVDTPALDKFVADNGGTESHVDFRFVIDGMAYDIPLTFLEMKLLEYKRMVELSAKLKDAKK